MDEALQECGEPEAPVGQLSLAATGLLLRAIVPAGF